MSILVTVQTLLHCTNKASKQTKPKLASIRITAVSQSLNILRHKSCWSIILSSQPAVSDTFRMSFIEPIHQLFLDFQCYKHQIHMFSNSTLTYFIVD